MLFMKTLCRRGAALCLTALMLYTSALAAEPAEKDRTAQRLEDLEFLYHTVLVENHPNVFANTPEAEFQALKKDIESRLETADDATFLLDLMRLTALVGDSHTSINGIGDLAEHLSYYPLSMTLRDGAWYIATVPAEQETALGRKVTAVNGHSMGEILETFTPLFSADNTVIAARRYRQYCQLADMYVYLGLAKAGDPIVLSLDSGGQLTLAPVNYAALRSMKLAYLSDRIPQEPFTAQRDAYYFAEPLTDSTFYIQYNICGEAEDLPMAEFAAMVESLLHAGSYRRILLDLRYNGGGSDGVIWPLFEVLRSAMNGGTELVGLIGPATFSSALINAVEIQEMGGVLVGESAGGSVCHFGAVRGFSLPNSGIRGQLSSKYIDLNTLLDAGAGRGVEALEPDVTIPQTMADTLAGKDTPVDWLLLHPERLTQKSYPDAPLTRGRFVGELYEAANSPAVTLDAPPFKDSFGIEWYLPALTWAKESGIALGGADGMFSAARQLTWQEAAVFMARALEGTSPAAVRTQALPATLTVTPGNRDAVTAAWRWGLLPRNADFTEGPTRGQGLAMVQSLAKLLNP